MPDTAQARLHRSAQQSPAPKGTLGVGMLVALALLAGLGPFAIDLYLPAFPTMASELGTTATGVQLSLTAFLIGAGAGQIGFGPWSDRAGRMVPLLSGIALFLVASVGTVVAGSIEMLVAARLLQGVGVAAGMVIGRAIVLDVCTGRPAARAMSLLMLIGGIAPVLAPVLGGLLVGSIGWRGLLAFVAAIGLGAAALTLLFVRESLPAEVRRQRRGTSRRGAWRALLTRGFAGNLAAYAFGMAIMMAYISASRSSTRR